MSAPTRFLAASLAYNANVAEVPRALAERGRLGCYFTGAADHWRSPVLRALRHSPLAEAAEADRWLRRRHVEGVPESLIRTTWRWEVASNVCGRLPRVGWKLGGWCWEQSELNFDERAAKLLQTGRFDAYLGNEHAALASLRTCRRLGLPSILTFTSPHHLTYERWVLPEYDRVGEIRAEMSETDREHARRRNARRDEELKLADTFFCNSRFTEQSLLDAGARPEQMLTAPLGCPPITSARIRDVPQKLRFLYAGPVSVRKGAHILLEAWRHFSASTEVELHFCGSIQLPEGLLRDLPPNVQIRGNQSVPALQAAYDEASFLVFPTLCDGFGMVATEALARGLPVVTTTNAGAATLIEHERNGLVIRPADQDALLAALHWCVERRNDLPVLSAAALKTAQNWTWAHFRAAIADKILQNLCVSA